MKTGMAFCLVVALLTATGAAAAPAAETPRTITVSGLGTVKAAPDEASFSTGVVSQGATASQALAANSRAMNAVMATLKKLGIPDKNIQTSDLSLSPQYQTCKPGVACPQRIVGYEVSNTVNVTADLAKTGVVLDALVASGSNQIGGISFSIHDPKPLMTEARAEAVKDAIDRAETIARAAGVTLGPILAIQEGGAEPPRPVYRAMKMMALASAPPPVAGGEESVSASVSITWQIQ
jgi:uncharacterized protein